jgi:invasion protein IalB
MDVKGLSMPIDMKRLGAVALAASLVLAGGEAFAQAQPRPAAPAPSATPPAAPAAPAGPVKVELSPSQAEWTKVCGKDPAANKEICYTTRDFGAQADQPPVLALAIYDVKGDDTKIVRLLMPVGLMLKPGFRFAVDKNQPESGTYEICFPNGCFAESKVKANVIDQLKKGTMLSVIVKNQVNNEITFTMPLAGFGKAFDGAAIDPKVLEDQQKQLADELQKRAEEERKKLEAAQPAPAAPAPAPAAPAKK